MCLAGFGVACGFARGLVGFLVSVPPRLVVMSWVGLCASERYWVRPILPEAVCLGFLVFFLFFFVRLIFQVQFIYRVEVHSGL